MKGLDNMKKQFATNLDVEIIKKLKLYALEKNVNVNDVIEKLVYDCLDSLDIEVEGKKE